METRLSRYILLLILLVAIGLLVHEQKNSGNGLTPSQKAVELFAANRYQAGLFCRKQGWGSCEKWADYPRSHFSSVNAENRLLPQSSGSRSSNSNSKLELKSSSQTDQQTTNKIPSTSRSSINNERHGFLEGSPNHTLAVCDKSTPTSVKQEKRKKQIYSWTDDSGQVHFTDSAKHNGQNDLRLTEYQEPDYAFELTVRSTGGRLPLAYRDKITAAIKKVSEIYEIYLPASGVQPVEVDLTLATTKASYRRLQNQYAPTLGPSQGFYVPAYNMAAVWHQTDKQAYVTSVHETVHVLNASLFGPTPRWFNEGLAEYFEGIQMSGYAAKIPAREWKRAFSGKSVSLDTLFRAKQETWAGSQQAVLYAQSHSLIHFLMSTPKGKHTIKALLAHMVQTRCEPSDMGLVLNEYPGGLNRLQNDWLAWMNNERYRTQSF